MFSIVIPLYNKEQSIKHTIASVLAQTYSDFELLVINDGSTDNSAKKVLEIKDARIKLLNKLNGGVSSARNLGINEANFEWIALLDGDDLWDSNYLMTVQSIVKNNSDIDFVASGWVTKNKEDAGIINKFLPGYSGVLSDYFKSVNEKGRYIFHTSAICVKKRSIISVGLFNENLSHGEDLDMWEKLSRKNKIWLINEPLVYYIQDSENRAMHKLPKIYNTRVYHIDKNLIKSEHEKTYYSTSILKSFYSSIRTGNFERAKILYSKQKSFITLKSLWALFLKLCKSKITGVRP